MRSIQRTRFEKIIKILSMIYGKDYETKKNITLIIGTNYRNLMLLFVYMEKQGLIEIVPEITTRISYRLTKKGTETFRKTLEVYRNIGMEIT